MNKICVFLFLAFVVGSAMSQCAVEGPCIQLGGNCTDTASECTAGSYCNFINSTLSVCTSLINAGQNCTSNYQCVGGDIGNTRCWYGTCQTVTMNGAAGANCNSLEQCTNSFYCNKTSTDFYANGTCATPLTKGQNCTASDVCGSGLLCNLGTCIAAFSVAEGQACAPAVGVITPCAPGLYCMWNATNSNGTCTKGFASSNAPCNSTLPCANSQETCACSLSNSGNQTCVAPSTISQSQATDFTSLMNCVVSDNCNMMDPSCCSSHKCTVYELWYHSAGALLSTCGSTNPYSSCDKSAQGTWDKLSKAEKIGIIVGAAAVVLIVVIVVACCCCKGKKKHYNEI